MHKAICTKPFAQRYKAKLTWDMCSNIYDQTFWIFHFLCGFGFFTQTKLKHKSKIKTNTMHINKCKMQKMYEDMTFNAWKVLQRSKELD